MRKSSFRLLSVLLLTLAVAPVAGTSVLPDPAPAPVLKACPSWSFIGCCPGQPGKQQQRDSCTGNTRCVTGPC